MEIFLTQCVIFIPNLYETKNINDADIDESIISTETPSLSDELKQFCDQSPTKLEIRNAVFLYEVGQKVLDLMG